MEKQGTFLFMPYDFRRPTLARIKERMWNPEDPRIFTPRIYGVGWTVNFATLKERSTPGFVIALVALALIYLNMFLSLRRGIRRLRDRLRSGEKD